MPGGLFLACVSTCLIYSVTSVDPAPVLEAATATVRYPTAAHNPTVVQGTSARHGPTAGPDRHRSVKFGLLNARSVGNKSRTIGSTIEEGTYDVFLLTKTWHTTSEKTLHFDVASRRTTSALTFHDRLPLKRRRTMGCCGHHLQRLAI